MEYANIIFYNQTTIRLSNKCQESKLVEIQNQMELWDVISQSKFNKNFLMSQTLLAGMGWTEFYRLRAAKCSKFKFPCWIFSSISNILWEGPCTGVILAPLETEVKPPYVHSCLCIILLLGTRLILCEYTLPTPIALAEMERQNGLEDQDARAAWYVKRYSGASIAAVEAGRARQNVCDIGQ